MIEKFKFIKENSEEIISFYKNYKKTSFIHTSLGIILFAAPIYFLNFSEKIPVLIFQIIGYALLGTLFSLTIVFLIFHFFNKFKKKKKTELEKSLEDLNINFSLQEESKEKLLYTAIEKIFNSEEKLIPLFEEHKDIIHFINDNFNEKDSDNLIDIYLKNIFKVSKKLDFIKHKESILFIINGINSKKKKKKQLDSFLSLFKNFETTQLNLINNKTNEINKLFRNS